MQEKLENAPLHNVFLTVFTAERHRIFRFIYSLVPIEADAEDIFQQTSVTLWNKFADYDQDREFYPWACGVARNAVLNFRRTARRSKVFFNDELLSVLAEERTGASQRNRYRQEMLEECMVSLQSKDRELIQHIYRDEIPAGKIAKQQERAVQTIYNRLNLIRNQLLECIERKQATR